MKKELEEDDLKMYPSFRKGRNWVNPDISE